MDEIALFIGTFDPFHLGHVWQIERTYKFRKFNKLVIAVIKQNPRKPGAINYIHRVELAKLYINELNFPFDIEIVTIEKNGSEEIKSFVKDSIKETKLFRTVGSDSIINIIKDKDRHIDELTMFDYVIGVRDFWDLGELQNFIASLSPEIKANFSYDILPTDFKNHLTATHIRHKPQESFTKGLITKSQLNYIESNNLYV